MTISVDDTHKPTSNFETVGEYFACIALVLHMCFLIYVLTRCILSKMLPLNTKKGKLSLAMLGTFFIMQILTIFLLYYDRINILFDHLSSFVIIGLLDQLLGYSKLFTEKFLSYGKTSAGIIHVVLMGPHYFLLIYWNVDNPFSIKIFQYMQMAYFVLAYIFVLWPFSYTIYYLQNIYAELDSLRRAVRTTHVKRNLLKYSYALLVFGEGLTLISLVGWIYSFFLAGLDSQLTKNGFATFGISIVIFELSKSAKKMLMEDNKPSLQNNILSTGLKQAATNVQGAHWSEAQFEYI